LPPVSALDRKEIAEQLLSTDPDDRTNVQMVAPDHGPAYDITVRPDNAPVPD
jgi:hypothetical protein